MLAGNTDPHVLHKAMLHAHCIACKRCSNRHVSHPDRLQRLTWVIRNIRSLSKGCWWRRMKLGLCKLLAWAYTGIQIRLFCQCLFSDISLLQGFLKNVKGLVLAEIRERRRLKFIFKKLKATCKRQPITGPFSELATYAFEGRFRVSILKSRISVLQGISNHQKRHLKISLLNEYEYKA